MKSKIILLHTFILILSFSITGFSQTTTLLNFSPDTSGYISVNPQFKMNFSKNLNPQSVNSNSVKLERLDDVVIPSTINYTDADLLHPSYISITPQTKLESGTFYKVIVTGNVTDISGNSIDGNNNGVTEGSPTDDITIGYVTALADTFSQNIQNVSNQAVSKKLVEFDMLPSRDLWDLVKDKYLALLNDKQAYENDVIQEGFNSPKITFSGFSGSESKYYVSNNSYNICQISWLKNDGTPISEIEFYDQNGNFVTNIELLFKLYFTWLNRASHYDKNFLQANKDALNLIAGLQGIQSGALAVRDAAVKAIADGFTWATFGEALVEKLANVPFVLENSFLFLENYYLTTQYDSALQKSNSQIYPMVHYEDASYYKYTESILSSENIDFISLTDSIWREQGNLANQARDIMKDLTFAYLSPITSKELSSIRTIYDAVLTTTELTDGIFSKIPSFETYVNFLNSDKELWAEGFYSIASEASQMAAISELYGINNTINISSVLPDKQQYLPNEEVNVTVSLKNTLTDATVTLRVNNGQFVTCNDVGNGEYKCSFSAPSTTGTYSISVNASKNGYKDADPKVVQLVVSNPSVGHDIKALQLIVSPQNVSPGNNVSINGEIVNNGIYSESNIPVVFSLKDPNGNTIGSKNYNVNLNPNDVSNTEGATFRIPTDAPSGVYYIAEIRGELDNDYDPTNNALDQSIYVGKSPVYNQYKTDYLNILYTNTPYNANGYTQTVTWIGNTVATVKVERSSYSETKNCYINQITSFDNNKYVLIYRDLYGADNGAFDYGIPSNIITATPNQLVVDAGSNGVYHISSSYSGTSFDGHTYGPDAETVSHWFSEKNNNDTNFDLEVDVPLNAERRTYSFWPTIDMTNQGQYAQILSLVVHEPHNISAISISPNSGDVDTIGKPIIIKGIFKDNGGYDENNVNMKLTIKGPLNFEFSANKTASIKINQQDTVQFDFNTNSLGSGSYSIAFEGNITNDPYNDNSISSNINLVKLPDPSKPKLLVPANRNKGIYGTIRLVWNKVSGAKFYSLAMATDSTFSNIVLNKSQINDTSTTIDKLDYGKTYYWRVQAGNDYGLSDWSPFWSFTTSKLSSISGNLYYDNESNSPLVNVSIDLKSGSDGTVIDSISAKSNYKFSSINSGSYVLSPMSTMLSWGGANSTDALIIRRYVAGLSQLSGLSLKAADVNLNGMVSSLDALEIRRRIVGLSNSFVAGDWIFEQPEVTLNDTNLTENIQGICVGDVNRSYDPKLTKSKQNIFVDENVTPVSVNKASFELPVITKDKISISAITLFIRYPAEYLKVDSIASKMDDLLYNAKDGLLSIAWDNTKPLEIDANKPLLRIEFAPLKQFKEESVSIDGNSEFADENGKTLNEVKLLIPKADYVSPKDFSLSNNYPNPFNPTTTIEYSVPEPSNIKLEIFNILGQRVKVLFDGHRDVGNYEVKWNAGNYSSGVYIYRLVATSNSHSYTSVKKMILLK
jgi:hypothetical protein